MYYEGLANHFGFDLDTPIKDLPDKAVDAILYGTKGKKIKLTYRKGISTGTYFSEFEGIVNNLERRYKETASEWTRYELESLMSNNTCPDCGGKRLRKEALAVTINDLNIVELTTKSIAELKRFFETLQLSKNDVIVADRILKNK